MKAFLLFNQENGASSACAAQAAAFIRAAGLTVTGKDAADVKAELSEARFLIFIVDSVSDFTNLRLSDSWRFFINELRWKRKKFGDIILICSNETDLTRIPFNLRDCNYLLYSELDNLSELILSFAGGNSPKAYTLEQRSRNDISSFEQRSKTSFSRQSLITPEASEKAPDNGCKDDHVYQRNVVKTPSSFKSRSQTAKTSITDPSVHAVNLASDEHSTTDAKTQAEKQRQAVPSSKPKPQNQSGQNQPRPQNQSGQNQPRPQNQSGNQNGNQNQSGHAVPPVRPATPSRTQGNPTNISEYKTIKGDPFDTPPTPPSQNKTVGCVIGGIFVAFFFIFIMIIINSL